MILAEGGIAPANAVHFDGAGASLAWSIPFAGLLLSIALLPLIAPHSWERHFGKVAAFWSFALIIPLVATSGFWTATTEILHVFLLDYLPFIILLFALFVVAGGIRVGGNLVGTPATNTAMLAFGTLSASFLGTTGASMVLIRPIIRANQDRRYHIHVFVFFIFLVSNIGGSLTPLGDPPLFLGFLKGVDFLWTLEAMLLPMLFVSSILLALFYVIDRLAWNRKSAEVKGKSRSPRHIEIDGLHNVLYLMAIALVVLASGIWFREVTFPIGLGLEMPVNGLIRDVALVAISLLSWRTTPRNIRVENAFTWAPMQEVAMLFAAIFITMIPMLALPRQAELNFSFNKATPAPAAQTLLGVESDETIELTGAKAPKLKLRLVTYRFKQDQNLSLSNQSLRSDAFHGCAALPLQVGH